MNTKRNLLKFARKDLMEAANQLWVSTYLDKIHSDMSDRGIRDLLKGYKKLFHRRSLLQMLTDPCPSVRTLAQEAQKRGFLK